MTAEAKRVFHAALQLPNHAREELVDLLEESLSDGTPEEIEAAWLVEVKRRIAESERGEGQVISAESSRQMRAEILERARARRAG